MLALAKFAQKETTRWAQVLAGIWYSQSLWFGVGLLVLGLCVNPLITLTGLLGASLSVRISRMLEQPSALRDGLLVEINGFFWGMFCMSWWGGIPRFALLLTFLFGLVLSVLFVSIATRVLRPWGLPVSVVPYSMTGLMGWIIREKVGGGVLIQAGQLHVSYPKVLGLAGDTLRAISSIHFVPYSSNWAGCALGFGVVACGLIWDRKVAMGIVGGALGMVLLGNALGAPEGWQNSGLLGYPGAMLGACMGSKMESLARFTLTLAVSTAICLAIWAQFENWGWIGLGFPYVFSLWVYELGDSGQVLASIKSKVSIPKSTLNKSDLFSI